MLRIVTIRKFPTGNRCWIFNQRIHHGSTGLALALLFLTLRKPIPALVALSLAIHDRHDWRLWFVRECLPEITQ
jgi:hypothetical protein